MEILLSIVFGLFVWLIARALTPGHQSMFGMTTIVGMSGMSGSLIGGLVGNLLAGREAFELQAPGPIGWVVSAFALLLVLGSVGRRRLI